MSALVIRPISPTTLQVQAMRLAFLNAMRKVATQIKADFEKTTATWKTKVKFEIQISLAGGIQVEVFTTNEIYGYVDEGTEAHIIEAKNAPFLVFKWGGPGSYSPKTKPGVIGSTGSSQSGTKRAFAAVIHPGNAPRGFTKEIQRIWQTKFEIAMDATMIKVAQASGHAL